MENTNFKVYIEKKDQDYGKLFVEPLERGYGDTVGNALRRLLLSSIKGVAVTAVRIDGVLHEFSTIPGVREDVIEVLMNLKHIPIKAKTEQPQLRPEGCKLLTLDTGSLPKGFFDREENPGVITAKDLRELLWDNDFEFCGDGVLCTLEPGAHLVMEIYVEPGVGYLSAERERPSHLPVDALLTDAIFSPVRRVNYQIESARVGQSIDYERLIVEVWTNGAVSPEEAVKQASTIARNYFGHIADTVISDGTESQGSKEEEKPKPEAKPVKTVKPPKEKAQPKPAEPAAEPDKKPEQPEQKEQPKQDDKSVKNSEEDWFELPLRERPVLALGLSTRSANCLSRDGIKTVANLLDHTHKEISEVRNLGEKSVAEIVAKLAENNLKLKDDPVPAPESEPEVKPVKPEKDKTSKPKKPKASKSDETVESEDENDSVLDDVQGAIDEVAKNMPEQSEKAEKSDKSEKPEVKADSEKTKTKSKSKAESVKKDEAKKESEKADKAEKSEKSEKAEVKKTKDSSKTSKTESVKKDEAKKDSEKTEKAEKAEKSEAKKTAKAKKEAETAEPETPAKPKKSKKADDEPKTAKTAKSQSKSKKENSNQ